MNNAGVMNNLLLLGLGVLALVAIAFFSGFFGEPGFGDSETLLEWEPRGPGGGGAVMVVHVDPNDGSNVFVGSDVGGLYKSEDGGQNYRLVNFGQLFDSGKSNYFVYDVKVAPITGVIFVSNRGGVFKSSDGGESFEGLGFGVRAKLGVSHDGQSIFVLNAWADERFRGFRRSLDGGSVWEDLTESLPLNITVFRSIAVDASGTVYVAGVGGIFKSADSGETWVNVSPPRTDVLWVSIHHSPPNELVLYATIEPNGFEPVLFKSLDGGDTWVDKSSGLEQAIHPNRVSRLARFSSVEVSPFDPNLVLVGGVETWSIMRSTDGGDSWTAIHMKNDNLDWDVGVWRNAFFSRGRVGKTRSFAFDPSNENIVFMNYEVVRSVDKGRTWKGTVSEKDLFGKWTGTGLDFVYVEAIEFDPQNPNRLYVGDNDLSMYGSEDGGLTWNLLDPLWTNLVNKVNVRTPLAGRFSGPTFRGFTDFEVVPSQTNIVFGSEFSAHIRHVLLEFPLSEHLERGVLLKSEDFARTWNLIGLDRGLPTGQIFRDGILVVEHDSSYDLYVGVLGSGVFKSTDEGETFTELSPSLQNSFKYPTALRRGQNQQTVFVSIASNSGDPNSSIGGIFRTDDGGQTWVELTSSSSGVKNVWSFRVDPLDENRIYAIVFDGEKDFLNGGVWRTLDGGSSWKRVLSVPRLVVMDINPLHPEIVYVGGWNFDEEFVGGIWRSIDGGDSWDWSAPSSDLASKHLWVQEIRLRPDDPSIVYIGTIGAGMFVARDPYAGGVG